MARDPRLQAQPAGKFFRNDDVRIAAEHDVDFMLGGFQIIQQALGVEHATGSGDGDYNSQDGRSIRR